MQTFLPYGSDFEATARALDRQRLGKQRVENLQILKTLAGLSPKGWNNHPAVRMWAGYEWALLDYQSSIVTEWMRRGYKDTCLGKFADLVLSDFPHGRMDSPSWIDDERLTYTHRGRLYFKDPEHYAKFQQYDDYTKFVCCPTGRKPCDYWWPTHDNRSI